MFNIFDGRTSLWQWDSNQRLIMNKFDIGTKVHFFNSAVEEALTTQIYEYDGVKVCDIPNVLLTVFDDISVYVYVEDELGNRTTRRKIIMVRKREKPSDYIYTETEVLSYNALEKRIAELEKGGASSEVKEIDPTVPDWAKTPEKPTYTADEVGALSQGELQNGVDLALQQAKESGEFDGTDGKSAYQIWLDNGNEGTEKDFLESLKGNDYALTEADKKEIAQMAFELIPVYKGEVTIE
jgi:hypothetical protein